MSVLDKTKRHHRFFEALTRIPHGSFNERGLSDYIVEFARARGLEFIRDEMNNVIIYKPASAGYEGHASLALQAHMDMVCERDEGIEHDFSKDPLELYIDGGYLRARGTTLGADDGTGIAYMLAVLDDDSLTHPPLEAVFTVQEEVGLLGAIALDKSHIRAERLISLDCGGGDSIYVSSLGGQHFELVRPLEYEKARGRAFRVSVEGLRGGYSTEYLSGAENAIKLCAELLHALNEAADIRLVCINGGKEGSKAAAAAEAVFTTGASAEHIEGEFAAIAKGIQRETAASEPGCKISIMPCSAERQLESGCSRDVLNLLYLLPSGLIKRNGRDFSKLIAVQSWTRAQTEGDFFTLSCALRAALDRGLLGMRRRAEMLSSLYGFEMKASEPIPAWEFREDSRLCAVLREVFREVRGKELGTEEVQGGLECSIFMQCDPDMDIIAMGPVGENVHTTAERLDLMSFDAIYNVFTVFLAKL